MSKSFDDAWDDIHATFDTKRQETRARAFARVLVHARDAEHKVEVKRLVDALHDVDGNFSAHMPTETGWWFRQLRGRVRHALAAYEKGDNDD